MENSHRDSRATRTHRDHGHRGDIQPRSSSNPRLRQRRDQRCNAIQLLYLSLAWGLGWKRFRMSSKLRGISETDRSITTARLVQAWADMPM